MSEKKEKTVYDLKLHEELTLDNHLKVLRVPGGWIYYAVYDSMGRTFVPYVSPHFEYTIEAAND